MPGISTITANLVPNFDPDTLSSLALLNTLHAEWEAGLTAFTANLQRTNLPQTSRDMLLPIIERMTQQIGELHARIQSL